MIMGDDEALTNREREIITLLANGLSNQAIADHLYLTLGTVKWYNKQIFAKLQVTSRTQAILKARQLGLLDAPQKTAPSNLPAQATSFIGREKELADIQRQVLNPACRLLTLFGPGGIGKTRLALEAASQCLNAFPDGVYFCQLQGVVGRYNLLTAITDTVGMTISSQPDPMKQLRHYLQHKSMLLVMDNFEQLLESSSVLGDILEAAPQVKCLVTSRELLGLRAEWRYYVDGLAFPDQQQTLRAETYPAVELFAARASQVLPAFAPEAALDDIIHICQSVAGMPLAIELAASWLRVMDCAQIAERLQSSLEFLTSPYRDAPARHRSMQAVFDASWQMLSAEQQNTFQSLAVFHGEFDLIAAQAVTGASPALLAKLVDKALLHRTASGRFKLHELLRQYAEHHLKTDKTRYDRLCEAHSIYYTDFLLQRRADVTAGHQLQAHKQISGEIHNIRSAWRWAVDSKRADLIHNAAYALYQYFRFSSRYPEADKTFQAAADALAEMPISHSGRALAEVLCYRAWSRVRSGDPDTAEVLFQQSLTIYNTLGKDPVPGVATDPLTGFGIIACVRGQYEEALRVGEKALAINEARGDPWNQAQANYILASAAFAQGRFTIAREYAQRAHDILEERHERWMITYMKNLLGNIASACGHFGEAQGHFHHSYRIYQEMADREGIARTLHQTAHMAYRQRHYRQAQELYLQSYRSYLDIGDQGGLATALCGLGTTANVLGETKAAYRYLHEALGIAQSIHYMPLVCSILVSLGEVFNALGQFRTGISLFGFAYQHAACPEESKERIRIHMGGIPATAKPLVEMYYAEGQRMPYDEVFRLLQATPADL